MINKDRTFLFEILPQNSICMEIGVWKGDFTDLVINNNNPKEYHLVDPWKYQAKFPNRFYSGRIAKNQQDMDQIFEGVKERFKEVDTLIYHRGYSEVVLKEFESNYFDWVYVDGNHSYKEALIDIKNSYRIVKDGGYIVVDDYQTWKEVKKASDEFIISYKDNIFDVIKKENQCVIKLKK